MVKIAGSFLKIQDDENKILSLDNACDNIHFDIMDGIFTENPTRNVDEMIDIVKKLKKPVDIHLMVKDLKKYIDKVLILKPNYITIHFENENFEEMIDYIKSNNIKVGLAINPETDVEKIYPYLDKIDLVLVMSVTPGKGGQKFIDISDKINKLKNKITIEVDGGINNETITKVKDADIIVTGSYITDSDDYKRQVYKLKKCLRNGFTLAELLGVISILSILGLIAITSVDNNLKESRYNSCQVQEKNLIEGAKSVITDYYSLLPSTSSTYTDISVKTMENGGTINGITIPSGYLEKDMINPMTDEPYSSNVYVRVKTTTGEDQVYEVIYKDTKEKCSK